MIHTETFTSLDTFLRKTLIGFEYLTWIEQGNAAKVLENPENYSLNHISANINAWADEENIIIEFNNIGIHYCFTPIEKHINGMLFNKGVWE